MDNYRSAFDDMSESDFAAREDEPAIETPPDIGSDERRMHVRAYNHWVSLLDGRAYPSIADLDPSKIEDFGPHSVLLDFTCGSENPAIVFLGRALRDETALPMDITHIDQVPSRSLLSRLTDQYLQIIANCAPIGFEAEFNNHRGLNTMYRGILMPFSSDGDTIDFIYGVINWKEVADHGTAQQIAREVDRALAASPSVAASPIWADGPSAEPPVEPAFPVATPMDGELELGVRFGDEDQHVLELAFDPDASLADRLCLARDTAEALKSSDARSRGALYAALGQAYDFAVAADQSPDDYAEILDDAGIKAQQRAPMTPVAKLIFGADYDKTRLTEFAAALSWGRRESIAQGEFGSYCERFEGGLKGIVQAERKARRPLPGPDKGAEARAALRAAPSRGYVDLAGEGEFVLLVARREDDGRLAVVAGVSADSGMIDRAIRNSLL